MAAGLRVGIGQYSDRGRKARNQDFHGAYLAEEPQLSSKGVAIALADGISSSDVSHIAAQAAVTGFLTDYYCTSEAWSVKTSVQRVLAATNAWLYAQTRQGRDPYHHDRGYVCTLSAVVVKATTAHVFHAGDSRVYHLRGGDCEQVTDDHRLWLSADKSYLSRALGMAPHLELDYHKLALAAGDCLLLATDGVYEFIDTARLTEWIAEFGDDLDAAAKAIVEHAYRNGSDDNLTLQLVRIDSLPQQAAREWLDALTELPLPPPLRAGEVIDGFHIVRELHASSRSYVYLAVDALTGTQVVIKTPATDVSNDAVYLERFMLEDWIARRIDNDHVLKPYPMTRPRTALYVVSEYIEGQTLAQWMLDHPKPSLATVRTIVEQIGKGLRAFHRLEMLHQDLRPANILIDAQGLVKIIDFGSARIAGIVEAHVLAQDHPILGTAQYTAPEYFLGEAGSQRSDLFSLAVIAYQMLGGRLPYGANVAKGKTRAAMQRLRYDELHYDHPHIPVWVDETLRKALHPDAWQRHEDVAEFLHELRHPSRDFLRKRQRPLLERNPLVFWKGLALLLLVLLFALAGQTARQISGDKPCAADTVDSTHDDQGEQGFTESLQ